MRTGNLKVRVVFLFQARPLKLRFLFHVRLLVVLRGVGFLKLRLLVHVPVVGFHVRVVLLLKLLLFLLLNLREVVESNERLVLLNVRLLGVALRAVGLANVLVVLRAVLLRGEAALRVALFAFQFFLAEVLRGAGLLAEVLRALGKLLFEFFEVREGFLRGVARLLALEWRRVREDVLNERVLVAMIDRLLSAGGMFTRLDWPAAVPASGACAVPHPGPAPSAPPPLREITWATMASARREGRIS